MGEVEKWLQALAAKDQQIERLYEKILKLQKDYHEERLETKRLKHELKTKNTDYLRVTGSLHIRAVVKEFEETNPILADRSKHRREKWTEMLKSQDHKSVTMQRCLQKCQLNVEAVPKIASDLFEKINNAAHRDFSQSHCDLLIVKKYFNPDELKLIDCIIECYGIETVTYVNK